MIKATDLNGKSRYTQVKFINTLLKKTCLKTSQTEVEKEKKKCVSAKIWCGQVHRKDASVWLVSIGKWEQLKCFQQGACV
jgi:hypothetical protein